MKAILELVLLDDPRHQLVGLLLGSGILNKALDTLHECDLVLFIQLCLLHEGKKDVHVAEHGVVFQSHSFDRLTLAGKRLNLLMNDYQVCKALEEKVAQFGSFCD